MDPLKKSKLRPLSILAFSVVLGIASGLPLIHGKNGAGLIVVPLVTVATVLVLSTIFNSKTSTNTASNEGRTCEILLPILSVFIGPIIAVGGGYITHLLSPTRPI